MIFITEQNPYLFYIYIFISASSPDRPLFFYSAAPPRKNRGSPLGLLSLPPSLPFFLFCLVFFWVFRGFSLKLQRIIIKSITP
ncbi:hypothetical protein RchiOBHm_Chr7g0191961 [Rosa chinensis]|uniref:Uncharacterized protein n=1 Tax=Rosa chinensis TaxID=74649 RepID=A0A2P6P5E7_ROSCH|nr:hypothetical protein RchiOBHm_Chr7g0191961 [Rosa chinensis]